MVECIKSNNETDECCIITTALLVGNCSLDFTLFRIAWRMDGLEIETKEFNMPRSLAIYAAGIVIVVRVRCASETRILRNFFEPIM